MNRNILYLAVVSAMFLLVPVLSGLAQEAPAPPPARQIPGINTDDDFPLGCVDCHIVRPEIGRDVRISTVLKEWADGVPPKFLKIAQDVSPEGMKLLGVHPSVEAMVKEIPRDCFICHARDSEAAPPLDKMVHLYHLTGSDENPYMTFFQGECTHCHKLNQVTGDWFMPSAPEK